MEKYSYKYVGWVFAAVKVVLVVFPTHFYRYRQFLTDQLSDWYWRYHDLQIGI
jgi:hypothetical protein